MSRKHILGFGLALAAAVAPSRASAERTVHWQLNPQGFPNSVPVFIDVEENGAFRRDLGAQSFALSIDEYAGENGGWILNQQQVAAGWAGAQVLIMVDRSRSYVDSWDAARKMMKAIVSHMDPARDQMAIGTFPTEGGFSEAKLDLGFTNNKDALNKTIDALRTMPKDDKSGARICNGLSEALRWFPEAQYDKYRVIILFTGGADKGEGEGNCVSDSFARGRVPFFPIVYPLDRKYDDPRNAHKIENKTHELATATGGQSIFRRSESENLQFVKLIWNRIRSQYMLQVLFPCFKPMPSVEHISVLKAEGKDVDAIKFKATSQPAPTPQITALYPPSATRKDVDDGRIDLTIDGSGFCGLPGSVKVAIGGVPLAVPKSQNPFRLVVPLNSSVESGTVKIGNGFGMQGESPMRFEVVDAPKGAEASSTLTVLVGCLVGLAVLSVILVSLRRRKAHVPPAPPPPAQAVGPSSQAGPSGGMVPKTMALSTLAAVRATFGAGTTVELRDGPNLVGREPTCAIRIDVPGVSREHARIDVEKARGLVWVEDLNSTNGTYVGPTQKDATRVEKRKLLSSGDVIWVGGEKIVVSFAGPEGA